MIVEKFKQALGFHQKGQLKEARNFYSEILQEDPNHANSLHFLGVLSYQENDLLNAVELIKKAISINPNGAAFYSNLGVVFRSLKESELAAQNYRKAIELDANNADYHYNYGNALSDLKQLESAILSYDKAISLNSNKDNYYYSRGNVFKDLEKWQLAADDYEKAVLLNPNNFEAFLNLGCVMLNLKKFDKALASYNKLLELRPNYAEGYFNIGCVMCEMRKSELAILNYKKAIELDPNYVGAYLNLALTLQKTKQVDLAVSYYNKVIELEPDNVKPYVNMGNMFFECGKKDLAVINYRKANKLQPDYEFLLGSMIYANNTVCDWNSYENDISTLKNRLQKGEKAATPFTTLLLLDSPELQLSAAKVFAKNRHPANDILGEISKREKSEKLRIGYYSADFYNHATSYLMADLFESHDRSKFEIIGFSFGVKKEDAMQKRIAAAFDKFIDVGDKSDVEIAQLSRDLGIDIAVDLKGFTLDMRAGIFANRAAPIQVNYLGYPGTMGASYMDYIIADEIIIPRESQKYYEEKVVYLPNSYQVNDSKRKISERIFAKKELGLPETGFVYCCFNNNYKITPHMFDIWMRILQSVEGSVLWLFESHPDSAVNLRKEAEKRGIDPDRLVFAKHMSLDEHLARHKVADLFLDTVPCNAHTTCSDALWAGLPVLTLSGESFTSRVSASLLNAVEMPELIAENQDEYERKAIEFGNDLEKLKEVKSQLERNKNSTALFDVGSFTSNIEKVYEDIYGEYLSNSTIKNNFSEVNE